MKTVCGQKKVQWVERIGDLYLRRGRSWIKFRMTKCSSPARKLVFPTHCIYVIRWTTEVCPLIEGDYGKNLYYYSRQVSNNPTQYNNIIIRRIKICHPRGDGDLVFWIACQLIRFPSAREWQIRDYAMSLTSALLKYIKNAGICVFISLSLVYHQFLIYP